MLELRIDIADDVRAVARYVGVVYRTPRGVTVEAARALLDGPHVTLAVPHAASEARIHLDPELGGPWEYAIGYVVALSEAGEVLAVCPHVRVLDLDGPFPVDRFSANLAAKLPGPDETRALLDGLRALPSGMSLVAPGTRPSRSLVGFTTTTRPAVLTLTDSLSWPPAHF